MADLTYRQQLALFCLATNGEPCTSADLLEAMGTAAQGAGHAREAWIDFSPARIARDLQLLEQRNLVVRSEPRFNTRRSRDEPTWQVVKPSDAFALPAAPTAPTTAGHVVQVQSRPIAGEPAPSPYADLPVENMLLLLDVHEEMAGIVSRFMREMGEFQRDAKRRLLAAGFEFRKP
jgi:hypothetical protein